MHNKPVCVEDEVPEATLFCRIIRVGNDKGDEGKDYQRHDNNVQYSKSSPTLLNHQLLTHRMILECHFEEAGHSHIVEDEYPVYQVPEEIADIEASTAELFAFNMLPFVQDHR